MDELTTGDPACCCRHQQSFWVDAAQALFVPSYADLSVCLCSCLHVLLHQLPAPNQQCLPKHECRCCHCLFANPAGPQCMATEHDVVTGAAEVLIALYCVRRQNHTVGPGRTAAGRAAQARWHSTRPATAGRPASLRGVQAESAVACNSGFVTSFTPDMALASTCPRCLPAGMPAEFLYAFSNGRVIPAHAGL